MAIKCAHCGRGDLMQAQVHVHQCLACGEFTKDGKKFVAEHGKPFELHK